LSQLSKAIAKIPGGVSNRWQVIQEMIPTRSINEIISKSQAIKTQRPSELRKTVDKAKADAFQRSMKAKKDNVNIQSPLSQRDLYDNVDQPQEIDKDKQQQPQTQTPQTPQSSQQKQPQKNNNQNNNQNPLHLHLHLHLRLPHLLPLNLRE